MLEASISAAQQLFTLGPLLAMLIVLPIALFAGLMPGGGLPVMVVVLGFAAYIDPWIATTTVLFYAAANDITEPLPAILMGIPGSRAAQATILDGYPLARQGLAGYALGASYMTTLIGGFIGAFALFAVLPFARGLLQHFSSAEFFLLALLGIMSVAIVSSGAVVKGLLTGAFGIAIATIGFSTIGGVVRANLGMDYLFDGITLIPVVIGLFAMPEAIALVTSNVTIARERLDVLAKTAKDDVYRGMMAAVHHWWLSIRSSLIGVFVGMLPGLGPAPAHWIAYAHARQTEKGAKETFGTGDIRGVIAADAANNACDGGVLIPTVIFGIPGSASMAIFMAILVMGGISPGPSMVNEHLDLTISFVYVILLGNIVVVPIMLLWSPLLARFCLVPPNIIAPLVIAMVTLSAFQSQNLMGDLWMVLVFSALGLFMKRYGWPRPPILIAVVLTGTLEKYLWISLAAFGPSMLLRIPFLTILVVVGLAVFFSVRVRADALQASQEVPTPGETQAKEMGTGEDLSEEE